MGGQDVLVLVLLRPTANQDNERFAILTEIDSISGAELDPAFIDAGADTPVFEKSHCSIRTSAVVTSIATGVLRLSNHASKGLRPLRSRYSLTVIMTDGNVSVTIPQAR